MFKQYLGTVHAAYSWAVQGCLVNQVKNTVRLFGGVNEDWGHVSFENLYTDYGLMASAAGNYDKVTTLIITSREENLEIEILCRDESVPKKVKLKKGKNIVV